MEERLSDRLIDKRFRNGIMEAVSLLARGDDGVRCGGFVEYFETFYYYIPHRDHGGMYPNSSISPRERDSLLELSNILDDAFDETPGNGALRTLSSPDGRNGYSP